MSPIPFAKTCTGPQTPVPEQVPPHSGKVELEHGTTPAGKQPQLCGGKFSSVWHSKPAGQLPLQLGKVPPQGVATVEVVVVDVVVTVLVVTQPLPVHASQQLAGVPTQALPPAGGVQSAALRFTTQRVAPFERVRQQVTAPGRPQVEREAQRRTSPLQSGGRSMAPTRMVMTAFAQCMNEPWLVAPGQQENAIAARVVVTADGSLHAAWAAGGSCNRTAASIATMVRMRVPSSDVGERSYPRGPPWARK
jgi:hypothetical protein